MAGYERRWVRPNPGKDSAGRRVATKARLPWLVAACVGFPGVSAWCLTVAWSEDARPFGALMEVPSPNID